MIVAPRRHSSGMVRSASFFNAVRGMFRSASRPRPSTPGSPRGGRGQSPPPTVAQGVSLHRVPAVRGTRLLTAGALMAPTPLGRQQCMTSPACWQTGPPSFHYRGIHLPAHGAHLPTALSRSGGGASICAPSGHWGSWCQGGAVAVQRGGHCGGLGCVQLPPGGRGERARVAVCGGERDRKGEVTGRGNACVSGASTVAAMVPAPVATGAQEKRGRRHHHGEAWVPRRETGRDMRGIPSARWRV